MSESIDFELSSSKLGERIGPFHSINGVASKLKVSVEKVLELTKSKDLLMCETLDEVAVYPTFQFTKNNEVINGVPEVLKNLSIGMNDGWVNSLWLTTPIWELYDESAINLLADGIMTQEIIQLALIQGNTWAH